MADSSLPAADSNPYAPPKTVPPVVSKPGEPVTRLQDLSSQQWKSGIAAWLGWLFDGLDMHLYTLVAVPFVAVLLTVNPDAPVPHDDASVKHCTAYIQAAFLVGWALGGGFFGRIGDRLGRSRALMLTILTYALFTGLSCIAQTWWHLLIFRFLAALGIGGEWAVGASLLSETWPRKWRPWIAAVLQSAVNCGVILACLAGFLFTVSKPFIVTLPGAALSPERYIFLVGILPALLVLWIRRAVPETDEWHAAKAATGGAAPPGILDLFRGSVLPTTIFTILVCSFSLTAHWAFTFWSVQHMRSLVPKDAQQQTANLVLFLLMASSIVGNFVAAILARKLGYRKAIVLLCLAYFGSMVATYAVVRETSSLWYFLPLMGLCQGVFGLFTMYLPPLFPVLLRTTGAGFCYNIGRLAAAAGTVFFGIYAGMSDYRLSLFGAGFLFLPAAGFALLLSEPPDEQGEVAPLD